MQSVPLGSHGDQTMTVVSAQTANVDGPRVDRHAPGLGEHTAEILAELGYKDIDINRLEELSVVDVSR